MSVSREKRATAVLQLCEMVARSKMLDGDDALASLHDGDRRFIDLSLSAFTSKMTYLSSRSQAQWMPGFQNALEQAHSIRCEEVSPSEKSTLRDGKMFCMACGKREHRCKFVIDMAGDIAKTLDVKLDATDRWGR